jgi:hypothetical protein
MDEINADDVSTYMRGRMGLFVGPEFTLGPGVLQELATALSDAFDVEDSGSFLEVADRCFMLGVAEESVRDAIRVFVASKPRTPQVAPLAKAKWSAIMSLCFDTHLEDRLQQESELRVSRHPVTILDDVRTPPPPRSTPSYKLLGRTDRDQFSCSATHYRVRRAASWRTFVKEFSDRVKDGPILCLGLGNMTWAVEDLLAEMYAQPSCKPYCLLLLAEDPILNNIGFRRLAESRTRLVAVRSSLGELMTAAVRADKIGYTPQLPIGESAASPFDALHPCDDIAIVVNRHLETATSSAEKERLLDLLFSPEIASWDPFVHDLDFRRTSETEYVGLIRNQVDSTQEQHVYSAVIIHGRAASGKTVLLKRIAYELAKAGRFVVWLRPSTLGESLQTIRYFLESVARSKRR